MPLRESLRHLFGPKVTPGASAPAEESLPTTPVKGAMGDVAWSESLLYANSDWPKYNPDELIRGKGQKIYFSMLQDDQIKACVHFKRDAITARRYYFEFDKEDIEEYEDANPEQSGEGELDDRNDPNANGDDDEGVDPRNPTKDAGRKYALPPNPENPPGGSEDDVDPAIEDGDEQQQQPGKPPIEKKPKLPPELQERISVLDQAIKQMDGSFLDVLNGIMSSMYNGFSMSEKVLKQIEVKKKTWYGVKHIRVKPFNSFVFDVDPFGNLEKTIQRWENREQEIDPSKFIHHVQNPDIDPHYGESDLRSAYRAWFHKDMAIRMMGIHLERHASGFIWLEPKDGVKINIGTPEYNNIAAALRNVSATTAMLLPTGVTLHLEKPNQTDAYEKAIAIHDKAIAKSLLVPNLLGITEQGNTGSYSQSQTQLEAFFWVLDAEASRLAETLNEQLFKPLCELNFGSGPYPKFCFEPISDALKLAIIKQWNDLVKGGAVTHTDTDEEHIRELLDFPEAGTPATPNPLLAPGAGPDTALGDSNAEDENGETSEGKPKKPGAPGKGGLSDETIAGRGRMATSRHKHVFSPSAVRRVEFGVIERRAAILEQRWSAKLEEVMRDGIASVKSFIRTNDLIANPDKVQDARLPASTVRKLSERMTVALREAWDLGLDHSRRELAKARSEQYAAFARNAPLAGAAAEKFLESRAASFGGDISDTTRKKITNIVYNGIKGEWALDEILARIDDEMEAYIVPWMATAVRTVTFEAINEARWDFFNSPELKGFVEAFQYSAIIDGKTTEICEHLDGKIYAVDSEVWATYTPPNHFNCRSLLVPITIEDKWQESPEPSIEPAEGFG